MAAAISTPRPLSFLGPSTSTQPSSLDQLTPLRRPRSPETSQYRPYSIHISEASPEHRRRSIIRSPSLMSMGLHFLDRTKEKEKGKEKGKGKGKEKEKDRGYSGKTPKPCSTSSDHLEPPLRVVSPSPVLLSKHATDRPSTSNKLLTLPREKGLKKKRSLSSLLTAASEGSTSTFPSRSASPSPVYIRSPLGTSDSLQLSPVDETNAKDDATVNSLEEEKRRPRRKPANNFVPKNTWFKRQNMKVHPYPLEATYMQAYEALQLDKCVSFVMFEVQAQVLMFFIVTVIQISYYVN